MSTATVPVPKMVKQIASAIEYLRHHQVLHLNIKSENILFRDSEVLSGPYYYLGDLGLGTAEVPEADLLAAILEPGEVDEIGFHSPSKKFRAVAACPEMFG
ncbi:hypothetical protein VTK56DRAFT_731 [Thermocarpiscus australiensis]